MQFGFGSGSLFGINTAANSSPQEFGALQEVNLDFSFSMKELHGRYQMPLTIARGGGKLQGKAKTANLNAKLFNELFFGQSFATGNTATVINEAGSVPAATTYTVTVANGATFVVDLGVKLALTGLPMVKVATAPAAGQYSVSSAGVYTFAAADANAAVLLSYTYTTTGGSTITINNQLMGTTPTFRAVLTETYEGQAVTVDLYKCTSSKLTLATKLEDFIIPELDFEAMANAAGVIGILSLDA